MQGDRLDMQQHIHGVRQGVNFSTCALSCIARVQLYLSAHQVLRRQINHPIIHESR